MFFRRLFILLALLLAALTPAYAQDLPMPIEPPRGVFTNPEWMSIDYHRVNIEVTDQIAATTVDMQFTNDGDGFVEGTFLFPLPPDAAVDNLIMFIDGQPITAQLLRANEAREIYDEIVRQYRDPALLEYVGQNTLQANVFPIPPGESRQIQIGYSQILEADNGLLKLAYPMENTVQRERPADQMSISISVTSVDPISNIYSPSHNVAISRQGETAFRVGFEANNYRPDGDFTLYYGLENESISVNLLSYRESADEDGFFMLLMQPPVTVPDELVVPKDVILVIDQSGSMSGVKWEQAQQAASYVLGELNPTDRFNVVVFSTGWRVFSNRMEPATAAPEAADWVNSMFAEGGTDINGALLEALRYTDAERPTTLLFLTDGLATEGVIETSAILENIADSAGDNVRVFAFGVGNDVDTLLLDRLTRDFRGRSSYVRPSENINEEVAALYNKISAPVLTDVTLDTGDVRTDLVYPAGQLPDLFAGEQLTVVGRYRQGAQSVDIRISGQVAGEPTTFTYTGFDFRDRAGGEPFIARLWATRRIGDLLNTIRLNGESEELVDSVVSLSTRYGIITPYTSFLIDEDDILSQTGRDNALERFRSDAEVLNAQASGGAAVSAADAIGDLSAASAPMPAPTFGASFANDGVMESEEAAEMELTDSDAMPVGPSAPSQERILNVEGKSFLLQGETYTDTTFNPDEMETVEVIFLSDAYFDLLAEAPELAAYFAIGERVIVVYEGVAYEVVPE